MEMIEIIETLDSILKSLGIDSSLMQIIEGVLTASTFGNIIKGVLVLVALYFSWRLKRWKAKEAARRSDEISAEEEARNRQQNQQQQQASNQDATNIDDILGDD